MTCRFIIVVPSIRNNFYLWGKNPIFLRFYSLKNDFELFRPILFRTYDITMLLNFNNRNAGVGPIYVLNVKISVFVLQLACLTVRRAPTQRKLPSRTQLAVRVRISTHLRPPNSAAVSRHHHLACILRPCLDSLTACTIATSINVKKLQFIHTVNGDGSKTAKIIKKGNVNHTNIAWMSMLVWLTLPFLWFLRFLIPCR